MPLCATVQFVPSGDVSTRYAPVAVFAPSAHASPGSGANWVTLTTAGSRTTRNLSVPLLVDQPVACHSSTAATGPQLLPVYSVPLLAVTTAPP